MSTKLWNDHGLVADLPGQHLLYMAKHGVEAIQWNLCKSELPISGKFGFVFFLKRRAPTDTGGGSG